MPIFPTAKDPSAMRPFRANSPVRPIFRTLTILILVSIVTTGIRWVVGPSSWIRVRQYSGVSRSKRIEFVAFRPQVPEKPPAGTTAPEPIGPVPSSGTGTPSKPKRRNAMETPKLTATEEPGRATVVKDLVGDKTCAECHPGEHALFFGSGHSRTLRPAGRHPVARKLSDKLFTDEENLDNLWRYVTDGDRVEAFLHKKGQPAQCVPLDWAVGSGEHGMTFMSIRHGRYVARWVLVVVMP
jgi:hypothetical protein